MPYNKDVAGTMTDHFGQDNKRGIVSPNCDPQDKYRPIGPEPRSLSRDRGSKPPRKSSSRR